MSSLTENLKNIIYQNWNDNVGIGRDEIEWTVKRVDVIEWLRSSSKNFLIAIYSPGQTTSKVVAPKIWKTEESLRIDVYVKVTVNVDTAYTERSIIKNEVLRIIHERQYDIPGVSWAYISQTPLEVEDTRMLRVILICTCILYHAVA